jgi:predicted nucleotidyltransferase
MNNNKEPFGLSQYSLQTLHRIFRRYKKIRKVKIYGSRAMGNFKPGSDIDITLFTDSGFSSRDLLFLSGDLDVSDLPYFVDVSIFTELSNINLTDHILRCGKNLYERDIDPYPSELFSRGRFAAA